MIAAIAVLAVIMAGVLTAALWQLRQPADPIRPDQEV